jgi:hypothetical protein
MSIWHNRIRPSSDTDRCSFHRWLLVIALPAESPLDQILEAARCFEDENLAFQFKDAGTLYKFAFLFGLLYIIIIITIHATYEIRDMGGAGNNSWF